MTNHNNIKNETLHCYTDGQAYGRLKFSPMGNNAKLRQLVESTFGKGYKGYSFSLPSGHSCPFAKDCLSKSDRITGKITDGKDTLFRCFSAMDEARSSNARAQRWHNFDILRKMSFEEMVTEIDTSIPDDMGICRVHVGGDMFNEKYFLAWLEVARRHSEVIFYAYTKSIQYWVSNLDRIPENFSLNASRGSRVDGLIDEHDLKVAEVVYSLDEAIAKGLEIDHDESHAIKNNGSFALLIHGTQPSGSKASEAIKELKRQNVKFSYSRKA